MHVHFFRAVFCALLCESNIEERMHSCFAYERAQQGCRHVPKPFRDQQRCAHVSRNNPSIAPTITPVDLSRSA